MTSRSRQLVKMLERLLKQELLYNDEIFHDMKKQLRVVKDELAVLEAKQSKGFGK